MGRDKGKFNKRGGRGGGKRFAATSAEEIELRNSRLAEFDEKRAERRADSDDEGEGGGDADIQEGMENLKVKGGDGDGGAEAKPAATMTRKQREEADRARKAADYRRRHELGLTDEYKRDMAKLEEVRLRRKEAQERAAEEKEVEIALEKERQEKAAAFGAVATNDAEDEKKSKKSKKKGSKTIPKLDKISIKKMKPAQLKEALKERDQDIQGNAKTLTKRLLDYESSR